MSHFYNDSESVRAISDTDKPTVERDGTATSLEKNLGTTKWDAAFEKKTMCVF
jgi:hypothetical protein